MVLTSIEIDALKEVINVGVGYAAGAINELVGAHVQLYVPNVLMLTLGGVTEHLHALGWSHLSTVQLHFGGKLSGNVALIFPSDSAVKLVSLLTGDEGPNEDVDGIRQATLEEVGNILLNGVMGSIANLLHQELSFSVPYYNEGGTLVAGLGMPRGSEQVHVIFVRARFNVAEHELEGEILIFLEVGSMEILIGALDGFIVQV